MTVSNIVWSLMVGKDELHPVICREGHGSSTRVPPGCIMRPAATFINYAYTIKFTQ